MFNNQLKTTMLLALLTGLLLVIGQLLGGTSGLTIALVIAIVLNFISYWYSDKIVLKIYRAKPAYQSEYPRLHDMIREVAMLAGLPKPKIFVLPSKAANAFATGRNAKHSTIAVTKGIMELLDENELKGVISHEMAHIKNRDILISSVAAVIAGAISYLAFMARFAAIFGGARDRDGGSIFELLALAILAPLIALIIRLAISRSREFLADETGARIIRNPLHLASALTKLNASTKANPMKFGNQATSHMFIVNPFSGRSLARLFSTHPDPAARIGRLRSMQI